MAHFRRAAFLILLVVSSSSLVIQPLAQAADAASDTAENCQPVIAAPELVRFALDTVNAERRRTNLPALKLDRTADSLAQAMAEDLCERNCLSHLDRFGDNPDLRYTRAGGTDSLVESLSSLHDASGSLDPGIVSALITQMLAHQDDAESLLSPDATDFGFSAGVEHGTAVACAEVITHHADIMPIAQHVVVGTRVELDGRLMPPYRFQRITVAWEGVPAAELAATSDSSLGARRSAPLASSAAGVQEDSADQASEPMIDASGLRLLRTPVWSNPMPGTQQIPSAPTDGAEPAETAADSQQNEEEVPYFPPLDYAAYVKKVPHDRRKLYGALKVAAIAGCFAGGAFCPPVLLAIPVIMYVPLGRRGLEAVSDIPLHGGIKVRGSSFSANIPISDQSRPGIYYLTVWATTGHNYAPVAVSRRAITATAGNMQHRS